MRSLDRVRLEPGGIPGDAHFRPGSARQVLMIEAETLRELGLEPGSVRENLTVGGFPLMGLAPGTRLRVGDAVLEVTGECEPCAVMDAVRPGLMAELAGRRGMLARVAAAGLVRRGDPVGPARPEAGPP